jgi:hypothetical protein
LPHQVQKISWKHLPQSLRHLISAAAAAATRWQKSVIIVFHLDFYAQTKDLLVL